MKPASFVYHAPKTVDEAVALLAETAAEDGRVLAGGQSLVPTMAFRMARPGHLIDINGIAEISSITREADALVIGAGVRHAAFHSPVTEGPLGKLLAFVVHHIAHYPIRQRGTFCGSLAHADPSSEWCLTAATLGATMVARGADGTREIAAEEFFQGIMTTALEEGEMLVAVRLPLPAYDLRHGFYEFSRRAGDYAMAAALATYRLQDGAMVEARLGLGGAEASTRRIAEAEALLEGQAPSDQVFRAAAEAAADVIDPLEDLQADAAFRRDLVRAVARRALERAAAEQAAA
jgi:carbon-monoxide dehydrogenase medium subunit